MLAADSIASDWDVGDSPPPDASSLAAIDDVLPGPFEQKVWLAPSSATPPGSPAPPPEEQTTGFDTVIDNGPSSNRVDIVILGDGYTASQITTDYVSHVNTMLEYLFNAGQDPYPRYANFFNAHRINTISNESGADQGANGGLVDTALDARYFCGGTERLICINNSKANAAKNTALAGAGFTAEMQFVTVNDSKYGGSGGSYAVFAGANSSANELALHEVAHSFNDLADEYGGSSLYTGFEPSEVNVTTNPTGAKWQRWHGYNQPGIGVIGAYEGARYYNQGLYRPSNNSKMRSLGRPFDAVSREKIILDIYDLVDPIDSYAGNTQSLHEVDPEVWVEPIDGDVLNVQWSVDGVDVAGATDETFSLRDAGFADGTYTVSARVFDPTDWVRHHLDRLEQTINWTVEVLPAVTVDWVKINDGESNRSQLTTIDVKFDTSVNVSSSSFVVTNVESGQSVDLQVMNTSSPTGTIAQLSFLPGDSVVTRIAPSLSSLVDGNYQLKVVAAEVTTSTGNYQLGADFLFGEQTSDDLFRLFGDDDGDRDVDAQDLGRFSQTFLESVPSENYSPWLDRTGDGNVDGHDFAHFKKRFGRNLPF